jgi:amino-acid N-acetyltransferase
VFALLSENELPIDGLTDHLGTLLIASRAGHVIGSAALEVYPDGALLRSVAVQAESRSLRYGRALTDAALALACQRHIPAVYLLITTAADYFAKLGFERIAREDVPETVRNSVEFTTACPASATTMRITLG